MKPLYLTRGLVGALTALQLARILYEAGVPTGAMVAPILPASTDAEIEAILKRVPEAGARDAAAGTGTAGTPRASAASRS